MKRGLRKWHNPDVRFIVTPDTGDGGGDGAGQGEAQEVDAPEGERPAGQDEGGDDDFDAARALEKIRKLNSENKNLREAKKAAEEKAASTDEKDQRIKALEANLLRVRIGGRYGLPDELIDRLKGDTEEEVLQDAERLLAVVTGRKVPTPRPQEALRGGTEPNVEVEETDPRKLAARIPRQ